MSVAVPFYDKLLPLLGFSPPSKTSAVIDAHEFHVVEYSHPRMAFAITSPRRAFQNETIHRRKPGALHHLAFQAGSRAEVDRLYAELKVIGAVIVTPPREYPEYTPPGYYALFFKDLEGIKYELVTHSKVIANESAAQHALGRPKRRIVSSTTKPFQVTSNGVFMERRGAGWNDERRFSQKKLCFIATDQALLVRVLSELADRPDCYYVKYSITPRDGMYLGRCFLLDDQEVGTLWREYKKHPRMMCNVQDDDFTLPFR